ncbi:hypothetical protein B0T11DRAFT_19983 [Plectosphaerella cucumerina]|uniref:Uncharacterized protein n=1 Tax=Plectosphaerella cucumerina TaxID=40658 RepID=A0A8K0X8Y7_9PEZI|nr:hypothetical protein B0T11DRAFT_19983 [Plectosphaerella cucumerina]
MVADACHAASVVSPAPTRPHLSFGDVLPAPVSLTCATGGAWSAQKHRPRAKGRTSERTSSPSLNPVEWRALFYAGDGAGPCFWFPRFKVQARTNAPGQRRGPPGAASRCHSATAPGPVLVPSLWLDRVWSVMVVKLATRAGHMSMERKKKDGTTGRRRQRCTLISQLLASISAREAGTGGLARSMYETEIHNRTDNHWGVMGGRTNDPPFNQPVLGGPRGGETSTLPAS